MKVMIIDQDWITPAERRMEIIKLLCYRRQDTMKDLADELGVTSRTIQNDINYLSLFHTLWKQYEADMVEEYGLQKVII